LASLACIPTPGEGVLRVGDAEPVRVMALVGTTSKADARAESEKIERIAAHSARPDLIADLSLRQTEQPLWQQILQAGFPAATLPIYTARRRDGRIDSSALFDRAVEQIEGGVGMVTIHPSARRDIIELARTRRTPWTSRGGGLVIADLLASSDTENVYLRILPDLASLARAYGVTISLGATFRSASVLDADDAAQRAEINFQGEVAAQLRAEGCSVVVEGPGHASPIAIESLARRMRSTGCPIMPLGPIPTDLSIGQDHISAAIGATLMGLQGAAHVLAAVTREEHTGGVPGISSTLEAIEAAWVAARVIDLHRFGPGVDDFRIADERSEYRTCVAGRTTPGCSRCGTACPL
jgi:phosphomethylpyrimidine synthase